MSYEPTILISKTHLHEKSDAIEQERWAKRPKKRSEREQRKDAAYSVLYDLLSHEGVKILGVVLIIAKPELTSFNREVRELLSELNIEYAVYD